MGVAAGTIASCVVTTATLLLLVSVVPAGTTCSAELAVVEGDQPDGCPCVLPDAARRDNSQLRGSPDLWQDSNEHLAAESEHDGSREHCIIRVGVGLGKPYREERTAKAEQHEQEARSTHRAIC